jgi:hypothetical protein
MQKFLAGTDLYSGIVGLVALIGATIEPLAEGKLRRAWL